MNKNKFDYREQLRIDMTTNNHPVHVKWVVKRHNGVVVGNYGLIYPVKEKR